MSAPHYRRAARLIVTDPEGRLLLFLVEPAPGRAVWITPGGGLEEGESFEDAARRELREEAGIDVVTLGPFVWTRRHVFEWRGRLIDQDERYFWIPSVRPDVRPPPATEAEPWIDVRWWTIQEVRDADHVFAPRRLADLVEDLLARGAPPEPFDVGV